MKSFSLKIFLINYRKDGGFYEIIFEKNRGFTLTELIVVIAIIGILAAVLIPGITRYIRSARRINDEQVTGLDFSTKGTYTLVVKYGSVSISYAYLVVDGAVDDTVEANTEWHNTTATAFSLYNVADMLGFVKLVNDGTDTFAGKTVFLMADLDLSEIIWSPIGEGARKDGDDYVTPDMDSEPFFMGTFDGQNHVISGLTDYAYIPAAGNYRSNALNKDIDGATFGLFGRVCNATIKNVVMSNVNITGFASYETTNYSYVDVKNYSVAAIAGYSWEI